MSAHRILIADDDDCLRETLGELLSRFGFGVVEAEDGPKALELFRRERPSLSILDFHMPGMTGLEVLRELRRSPWSFGLPDRRPEGRRLLPSILLSAEASEEERAQAMDEGAFCFLDKPLSIEDLFLSVRRLYDTFLPGSIEPHQDHHGMSFTFRYESVERYEDGELVEEHRTESFALIPIEELDKQLPVPLQSMLAPELLEALLHLDPRIAPPIPEEEDAEDPSGGPGAELDRGRDPDADADPDGDRN